MEVLLVIALLGFAAYFTGLASPFQGDDTLEIVQNPLVHSISNFAQFFGGGQFYVGQSGNPLGGAVWYRPLATASFSLVYTLFGANPVPFHVFQLAVHIASAVILFHVFRFVFRTAVALPLALIFLVHPISSQAIYAIPNYPDVLFFFFGILAFWVTLRFRSALALIPVVLLLFLGLLCKESAAFFILTIGMYLSLFDRRRLAWFVLLLVLPVAAYAFLRLKAIGLAPSHNFDPMDNLDIWGRLFTVPSEIAFYLWRFIFPVPLATGYFWLDPQFTFTGTMVPLAIDLCVIGLAIYLGMRIRKRAPKALFRSYLVFAAWTVIGLVAHLNIFPLDFTANEAWFYFPIAGVLGMIGVAITALGPKSAWRSKRKTVLALASILILVIGARTALRGLDWNNPSTLAQIDVSVSPEDFNALVEVSYTLVGAGDTSGAVAAANKAATIFPDFRTLVTQGSMLLYAQDYPDAQQAFLNAIYYQQHHLTPSSDATVAVDDFGVSTLWYDNYDQNKYYLTHFLLDFPQDGELWYYLAILYQRHGDNADAKTAIAKAYTYGIKDPYTLNQIQTNGPINVGPIPVPKFN